MNFIEETTKSIYNKDFYASLREAPVKHSVGYFFKLSCVLALLSTFIFAMVFIPRFMNITSTKSVDSLIALFPKELTLTIEAGHLSTNVPEPYTIKMPVDLLGVTPSSKPGAPDIAASTTDENLIVISTQADPSLSEVDQILKMHNSRILVTGTSIISKDDNGKTTIQSLANFPNTTINQENFRSWINKMKPLLKFIIPIGIPFFFLAFLAFFSLNLLIGFFVALPTLLLGKVCRWELSYWQSYAISLHAMTLGLLVMFAIRTVTSFFPIGLYIPQFSLTILTLVVVYLNLKGSTASTSQVPTQIS